MAQEQVVEPGRPELLGDGGDPVPVRAEPVAGRVPVPHVRKGADHTLAGLEGAVDVLDVDHHETLVELLHRHRPDPERVEPEPRVELERLPRRVLDVFVGRVGAEHARLVGGHRRPDAVETPVGHAPERLEHAAADAFGERHREPLGGSIAPVAERLASGLRLARRCVSVDVMRGPGAGSQALLLHDLARPDGGREQHQDRHGPRRPPPAADQARRDQAVPERRRDHALLDPVPEGALRARGCRRRGTRPRARTARRPRATDPRSATPTRAHPGRTRRTGGRRTRAPRGRAGRPGAGARRRRPGRPPRPARRTPRARARRTSSSQVATAIATPAAMHRIGTTARSPTCARTLTSTTRARVSPVLGPPGRARERAGTEADGRARIPVRFPSVRSGAA